MYRADAAKVCARGAGILVDNIDIDKAVQATTAKVLAYQRPRTVSHRLSLPPERYSD